MKVTNFCDLKKIAVEVKPHLSDEKCFTSKDEVLAFIKGGKMYAVPWCRSWLKILEDAGFKRSKITVPFDSELVSDRNRFKWNKLLDEAKEN